MALPTIPDYDLPADHLPAARVPWRLETDRAALLIHDMQRYFCAAYGDGAVGRIDSPIGQAARSIASIAQAARAAGIPVFYTAQKGNQLLADRGLQADFWGPGMKAIPEHEEIVEPLTPDAQDLVLHKHRYSAFQRSNLETLMRARGRDQIIVTGIYAHIGCLATAAEAFQRDIQPFFVADALADFDRARHDMAVAWVAGCCGVPLTASDVVAAIGEGKGA